MLTPIAGALFALGMNISYSSFNCSDIVGVVFDDQNRNGYHDTNERGLASVRIATINGVWVTTDRLGRFRIPCAMTPGRFGANFVMKLDMRSLPVGYRATTQNPQWIRATAGRVHVVKFGATFP